MTWFGPNPSHPERRAIAVTPLDAGLILLKSLFTKPADNNLLTRKNYGSAL